ncbi:uncharacterized protein [Solanum lycopersicum]|uniref:uncharacterized protein n=1 Tax=Solanum lycopersicum TaxID=4081 RepID=UPI00374817A4
MAIDMNVHELLLIGDSDFLIYQVPGEFVVPECIITDNGAYLNSYLMRDICDHFKITHQNSTASRHHMNGAIEAANKNIKKILRKKIKNHRRWHEMLPYTLLGYRLTVKTSTGATLYMLLYRVEAIIPAEVQIPSLRIIKQDELRNAE